MKKPILTLFAVFFLFTFLACNKEEVYPKTDGSFISIPSSLQMLGSYSGTWDRSSDNYADYWDDGEPPVHSYVEYHEFDTVLVEASGVDSIRFTPLQHSISGVFSNPNHEFGITDTSLYFYQDVDDMIYSYSMKIQFTNDDYDSLYINTFYEFSCTDVNPSQWGTTTTTFSLAKD